MIPLRVPKPGTVREYLRARIQSPAISLETVSEVLGDAGFGPPVSVRNLTHGWRTNIVMVITSGPRLILRRYPDRWSDSAVEHEHSLLLELERRDYLAPRLIELGDGSYTRRIDGARYSVQTFEPGRVLTGFYMNRAEIQKTQRSIGTVLAEFHRVLEGFVPSGEHHLGIDPHTGRQRRDLDWHIDAIDRLDAETELGSPFGNPDEITSLRTRLVELDDLIEATDLPKAIVHGDYGLHNIIFRESGRVVVHDFELSRWDIRLLDLAASLSRLWPEYRADFLDGLLAGDGVSSAELEMLGPVWEWYRIRGAVQSAEAYSRLGGQHRRAAVSRRLDEAGEIRSGRGLVPGSQAGPT